MNSLIFCIQLPVAIRNAEGIAGTVLVINEINIYGNMFYTLGSLEESWSLL